MRAHMVGVRMACTAGLLGAGLLLLWRRRRPRPPGTVLSDRLSTIRRTPAHVACPADHPESAPKGILPGKETVRFDPAIHLQLEPPAYIKTLSNDLVQFPLPVCAAAVDETTMMVRSCSGHELPFTGLAYSAPFRLLSDAGVKALRDVIAANHEHAHRLQSRSTSLRGLGYRSQFVRDFNLSAEVLAHFSSIAGTPLGAHHMGMNMSHTNFGEIGDGRPVDSWHIDSVPFVCVILLSDATDMVGGRLQVAMLGEAHEAIRQVRAVTLDASAIDEVDYPGPGFCIFMQGSRIAHAVTPVLAAREPRLTCVNSYMSLNPFASDPTLFTSFKKIEAHAAPFEYARHVAWRVRGQLDYLMRQPLFGEDETIVQMLADAARELASARDLLSGREEQLLPYQSLVEKRRRRA